MDAYIITNNNGHLNAITCRNIIEEKLEPELYYNQDLAHIMPITYCFSTNSIVDDQSPTLVSLPAELLLRIREYNIDAEHEHTLRMNYKLKQKNHSLNSTIKYHINELNRLREEANLYHEVLADIIDKYPVVAAEVAFRLGDLDAACYFAEKANEEESDKCK